MAISLKKLNKLLPGDVEAVWLNPKDPDNFEIQFRKVPHRSGTTLEWDPSNVDDEGPWGTSHYMGIWRSPNQNNPTSEDDALEAELLRIAKAFED
jgi:hypothetical protein